MEQTLTDSGLRAPTDIAAFSIADIAKRLSVSPGFIRLEIARAALKPLRLGRRVLILQSELERYLAAHSEDVGDKEVRRAAN
jgi:excisionase family DNA binding protein